MRQMGRARNGQIYARSHPEIVAPLKRDALEFGLSDDVTIHGRPPELGDLINGLVLAYGNLEPAQRKAIMRVLLPQLQAWQAGAEILRGDALVAAVYAALQPVEPTSAPVIEPVHGVARPAPRRRKKKGNPGAESNGKQVRSGA